MRKLHACLALALALAVAALQPAHAAGMDIASVIRVQGLVEAVAEDETARMLASGDRLARGEALRTASDALVLVRLDDGSELTLGGGGELVLDNLIAPPEGDGPGLLSVLSGAFLLKAAKTPDASVRTPVATIGIRGTEFWGGSLDNALDVLLTEGKIAVSTSAGTTVLDQPGQGTVVKAAGEPPAPPSVWGAEKVERAKATIRFAP